ncbi:hypothetical protein BT96DRAFT_927882 [Gymnopus androsaceus JB14]|uniref:Zn(2)-C6 fungal-type domain-containing protein n=1 Tax=Gymnopus androsaceus JB14 TaxID=1447944 RepID=A0A6A4GP02_9AGAR|nr:hypothetical protein BT96DRAFT_927882 [Gymnopus androsaceus JB14]
MSTNATAGQQKAQPPSKTPPPTEGSDGKRRRNRAILSCLSCHTSKRMCDRKRPNCTRCTELGLLCVYEVDDFCQRLNIQEGSSVLLKRMTELEAEIEELKNNRHSQYLSESSGQHGDYANMHTAHPSSASTSTSSWPNFAVSPVIPNSTPSSSIGINDASAGNELTRIDMSSILSQSPNSIGFEDSVEMHHHLNTISSTNSSQHNAMQPCDCIQDASNYQIMLELSLRLRRAAQIMGQYPLHHAGRYCLLHQALVEFDTLTAETLSSVDPPHRRTPSYNQSPALSSSLPTAPHASGAHSTSHVDSWISGSGEDSLMSWERRRG